MMYFGIDNAHALHFSSTDTVHYTSSPMHME